MMLTKITPTIMQSALAIMRIKLSALMLGKFEYDSQKP